MERNSQNKRSLTEHQKHRRAMDMINLLAEAASLQWSEARSCGAEQSKAKLSNLFLRGI